MYTRTNSEHFNVYRQIEHLKYGTTSRPKTNKSKFLLGPI